MKITIDKKALGNQSTWLQHEAWVLIFCTCIKKSGMTVYAVCANIVRCKLGLGNPKHCPDSLPPSSLRNPVWRQ